MKTLAATALVMMTSVMTAGTTEAASMRRVDELALSVKRQAADICHELRYSFRNTPQYRHLYNDCYQLYALADEIHDLSHTRIGYIRLVQKADQMEHLIHHVEEVLDEVRYTHRRRPNRRIVLGGVGIIQHHPLHRPVNRWSRVTRMFDNMNVTWHRLHDEIYELARPRPLPHVPVQYEVLPPQSPVVIPQRRNRFPVRPIVRPGINFTWKVK